MRTQRILISLVVAAALLAGAGCSNQPPKTTTGRIGQIKGTITWASGSAEDHELANNALVLRATTSGVEITNVTVTLGPRSISSGRVRAPYSVGNLPREIPIQLDVKGANGQVNFVRDANPQDALCTVAAPIVAGFDFHALS